MISIHLNTEPNNGKIGTIRLEKRNFHSFNFKFVYLGFHIAFNTVQVISRRVVGRAEETSTYSWSRLCTVNC